MTDAKQRDEVFTPLRRNLLLFFSVTMIVSGTGMYLIYPAIAPALTAILIRVGVMLMVVWIAWPQLHSLSRVVSPLVLSGIAGMLVLLAARPNLFRVAAALIVILVVLSLAQRMLVRR